VKKVNITASITGSGSSLIFRRVVGRSFSAIRRGTGSQASPTNDGALPGRASTLHCAAQLKVIGGSVGMYDLDYGALAFIKELECETHGASLGRQSESARLAIALNQGNIQQLCWRPESNTKSVRFGDVLTPNCFRPFIPEHDLTMVRFAARLPR
jgi:hypothetical protein